MTSLDKKNTTCSNTQMTADPPESKAPKSVPSSAAPLSHDPTPRKATWLYRYRLLITSISGKVSLLGIALAARNAPYLETLHRWAAERNGTTNAPHSP
jgi:hypothetical protein